MLIGTTRPNADVTRSGIARRHFAKTLHDGVVQQQIPHVMLITHSTGCYANLSNDLINVIVANS